MWKLSTNKWIYMLDLYPSRLIWAEDEERRNKQKRKAGATEEEKRALNKIDFVTSINQSHFAHNNKFQEWFISIGMFILCQNGMFGCFVIINKVHQLLPPLVECWLSIEWKKVCFYAKLYKWFRLPVEFFRSLFFRSFKYNGKCLHAKVIRIYEMYYSFWWQGAGGNETDGIKCQSSEFRRKSKCILDRNSARHYDTIHSAIDSTIFDWLSIDFHLQMSFQ